MEERICVVRRWLESEVGTQFVLQYDILVDLAPLPGGGELELFGVAVRNMQTGEETGVPAIFLHMEEAEALVEKIGGRRCHTLHDARCGRGLYRGGRIDRCQLDSLTSFPPEI